MTVSLFGGILAAWMMSASSEDLPSHPFDPGNDVWIRVEPNMTWCGARALEIVCQAFGKTVNFPDLKAACDLGDQSGVTSLKRLGEVANSRGLAARPVHCTQDWLKQHQGIALTVHRFTKPGSGASEFDHCMVFIRVEEDRFQLVDPHQPNRIISMTAEDFSKSFTGDALLLARNSSKLPSLGPRSAEHALLIYLLMLDAAILLIIWGVFWRRGAMPAASTSVAVGVCVAVFAASLSGCNRIDVPPPAKGPAVIRFDAVSHQFPDVRSNSQNALVHRFRFSNASSEAVRLVAKVRGCSCTVASMPHEPTGPGMNGEVELQLNTGARVGLFSTYVVVGPEGKDEDVRLDVSVKIVANPHIEPSVVQITDQEYGRSFESVCFLHVPLASGESPADIADHVAVRKTSEELSIVTDKPVPSDVADVVIIPIHLRYLPAHAGPIHEVLGVSVVRRPLELPLTVSGRVVHPRLRLATDVVSFGKVVCGSTEGTPKVIRVMCRKESAFNAGRLQFRFGRDEGTGAFLEAEIRQTDDSSAEIHVVCHSEKGGVISGWIELEDVVQPPIRLRYVGYAIAGATE